MTVTKNDRTALLLALLILTLNMVVTEFLNMM